MKDIESLKYPIGKYKPPENITQQMIQEWISQISILPKDLRTITVDLRENDLPKTYRPGGWTVRQIVHHIADSHLNSYIRFKWTLTEDNPKIKAYYEERWAELIDSKTGDLDLSVDFIEALHMKWSFLLKNLKEKDWDRTYIHPESDRQISLKWNLGLYAWHGNHHLAHIKLAIHS